MYNTYKQSNPVRENNLQISSHATTKKSRHAQIMRHYSIRRKNYYI